MHSEEKLKSRVKRLLKDINLAEADCLEVGAPQEAHSASNLPNLGATCRSIRQKSVFARGLKGSLLLDMYSGL